MILGSLEQVWLDQPEGQQYHQELEGAKSLSTVKSEHSGVGGAANGSVCGADGSGRDVIEPRPSANRFGDLCPLW